METVQIKRRTADGARDILTLDENGGAASISIEWIDPTHLKLRHRGGQVVWQAARLGEVSIATRGEEAD